MPRRHRPLYETGSRAVDLFRAAQTNAWPGNATDRPQSLLFLTGVLNDGFVAACPY